jgi:hypothetical protein
MEQSLTNENYKKVFNNNFKIINEGFLIIKNNL